jgi:hypothetical protein
MRQFYFAFVLCIGLLATLPTGGDSTVFPVTEPTDFDLKDREIQIASFKRTTLKNFAHHGNSLAEVTLVADEVDCSIYGRGSYQCGAGPEAKCCQNDQVCCTGYDREKRKEVYYCELRSEGCNLKNNK